MKSYLYQSNSIKSLFLRAYPEQDKEANESPRLCPEISGILNGESKYSASETKAFISKLAVFFIRKDIVKFYSSQASMTTESLPYTQVDLDQELILATKEGDAIGASLLLFRKNPDVNAYDAEGRSALAYAYTNKMLPVINQIIRSPLFKESTFFAEIDCYAYQVRIGDSTLTTYSFDCFPGAIPYIIPLINLVFFHQDVGLWHTTIRILQKFSENTGQLWLPKSFRENLKTVGSHGVWEGNLHLPLNGIFSHFVKEVKIFAESLKKEPQTEEKLLSLPAKASEHPMKSIFQSFKKRQESKADSLPNYLIVTDPQFDLKALSPAILQDALIYLMESEAENGSQLFPETHKLIQRIQDEKLYACLSHTQIEVFGPHKNIIPLHKAIQLDKLSLCEHLLEVSLYSQLHFIPPYYVYHCSNYSFEKRLQSKNKKIHDLIESKSHLADICDYEIYIQKRRSGLVNITHHKRMDDFNLFCRNLNSMFVNGNDHLYLIKKMLAQKIKEDSGLRIPFTSLKITTENHTSILQGILTQIGEGSIAEQTDNLKRMYQHYQNRQPMVSLLQKWEEGKKYLLDRNGIDITYLTSLEMTNQTLKNNPISSIIAAQEYSMGINELYCSILNIPYETLMSCFPNAFQNNEIAKKYDEFLSQERALEEKDAKVVSHLLSLFLNPLEAHLNIRIKITGNLISEETLFILLFLKYQIVCQLNSWNGKPMYYGHERIAKELHKLLQVSPLQHAKRFAEQIQYFSDKESKNASPNLSKRTPKNTGIGFCHEDPLNLFNFYADLIDYDLYIHRLISRNDSDAEIRRAFFKKILGCFSDTVSDDKQYRALLLDTLKNAAKKTKAPALLFMQTENHTEILNKILFTIGDDPETQAEKIREMYAQYARFKPQYPFTIVNAQAKSVPKRLADFMQETSNFAIAPLVNTWKLFTLLN